MARKTQPVMFAVSVETLGHVICQRCRRQVNLDHCDVLGSRDGHVFCCFCSAEISVTDGSRIKQNVNAE